jgi:hypothetical protein
LDENVTLTQGSSVTRNLGLEDTSLLGLNFGCLANNGQHSMAKESGHSMTPRERFDAAACITETVGA